MLNARARLKARMRRGIDRKVLGEFGQKGIPATQATSSMEKEQGHTAAIGADLSLEHTVADGDSFFLHVVPSLKAYPLNCTSLLLGLQHTERTGPCQRFS